MALRGTWHFPITWRPECLDPSLFVLAAYQAILELEAGAAFDR